MRSLTSSLDPYITGEPDEKGVSVAVVPTAGAPLPASSTHPPPLGAPGSIQVGGVQGRVREGVAQ